MTKRMTPYTERGISRVPCFRCDRPSVHQWQICADDNVFRGLCDECDEALNELVLRWMGFTDAFEKIKRYQGDKA